MLTRYVLNDKLADLWGGGRGYALVAITGGSFMTIGVQMIYPVLLSELRNAYELNLALAGLLLSVLWVVNAFGQLPGGILADQIGDKATLLVSALLTTGTIVYLILGQSVVALFVATALLGLAIGLFGVARYTVALKLYPERAGTTIGIMVAGADAGQALLPPIAGILATAMAWQFGFGFAIPLFCVLIISIWVWVPGESTTQNRGDTSLSWGAFRTVLQGMRNRVVGLASVAFFLYMAMFITFTSFYPTYLVEIKGLTPNRAGVLFGLFFATGIGMKPLAGALYDRIGIQYALPIIGGISGIAWLLLPFLEGIWLLALLTVFMGPVLGTGAISQTHMLSGVSEDIQGTALGVVRTIGITLGGLLPTVVGSMADRGFFNETFFGLASLAGFLVILARFIPTDRV